MMTMLIAASILAAPVQKVPAVPRPMPKFDLKDTKGQRWTNEKIKKTDKLVLVEFWATWCSSCKEMEPMIKELYGDFREQKFEMLSVSIDETPADVAKHLKTKPFPNPVLIDPAGKGWKEWKVENVPAFFLVKDNEIVWQAVGKQERETLEKAIKTHLAK